MQIVISAERGHSMQKITAVRGLNRNQLKYIAAAAMAADHIGAFLLPHAGAVYFLCRLIGRLTAPIMCYCLAEGFYYTSSRKNYALRLLVFAVLSQAPYAFLHGGFWASNLNVLFTLLAALCTLAVYESVIRISVKWALIAVLLLFSLWGDWGVTAPLWVLLFYLFRGNFPRQMAAFALIAGVEVVRTVLSDMIHGTLWYGQLWQLGMFLFIPLMLCYNGRRGRSGAFGKWFFYVFYPLHLAVIGLIRWYAPV